MKDWRSLLSQNFEAKEYSIDMVRDYTEIICRRLSSFNNIDKIEKLRAEKTVKEMASCCKAPVNKNRMYIVSGIQFMSFAWTNIHDNSIKLLKAKLKSELCVCEVMPIDKIEPNLISSIYIFEDDQIVLCEHIYPYHLAITLDSLRDHNLIINHQFEV